MDSTVIVVGILVALAAAVQQHTYRVVDAVASEDLGAGLRGPHDGALGRGDRLDAAL